MQEFNLGDGFDVSITLSCELCSWVFLGGGEQEGVGVL